ncbi:6794_t:CDS:2 [Ambispora gerdemannii]|uniref:6794_t:CDS:1 n=1 Tax=Ambispora gerdemannii TaxID=144530 RepID=A0A9N9G385_9GLOM|nr:6794_t:CDS:2 [Ambispora gerdemannii]
MSNSKSGLTADGRRPHPSITTSAFSSLPTVNTPPPGHGTTPPGHAVPLGHESFIPRDPSMSIIGSYDYDVSDYYYPDRSSRDPRSSQQQTPTYSSSKSRGTLSPTPIPIPKSSTRPSSSSSQSRGILHTHNLSAPDPKIQNPMFRSVSPNSANYAYPSNNSMSSPEYDYFSSSSSHPNNSPPSPYIVPDPPLPSSHDNNSTSYINQHSQHLNYQIPSQSFSQEFPSFSRPESLADPFNIPAGQNTSRSFNTTSETPNQQQRSRQQPPSIPPPQSKQQHQNLQFPPTRQSSQRSVHSVQNVSLSASPPPQLHKASSTPALHKKASSVSFDSEPTTVEEYVQKAIKYHENDQLEKSAHYLRIAAEQESPAAMVLYGIALRHGWGCKKDEASAFRYLQMAAKSAVNDPTKMHQSVNMSSVKGEMVLAIYELGMCFRHGWGVVKNKSTAAYYFEIAANMGDPDAQNDIALCYYKGEGVKKDMKLAAKYYRMAHAQGQGTMGNSWIFKSKYDNHRSFHQPASS